MYVSQGSSKGEKTNTSAHIRIYMYVYINIVYTSCIYVCITGDIQGEIANAPAWYQRYEYDKRTHSVGREHIL